MYLKDGIMSIKKSVKSFIGNVLKKLLDPNFYNKVGIIGINIAVPCPAPPQGEFLKNLKFS
jgi:hypothetical protein